MSVTIDTGAGAPESLRVEQTARLREFLGLSLKNGLLNIITLTLYRFWGRTEVRRRLWSTTLIDGEPLEYTGRGKELFLGFLLAVCLLVVPLLLVMFGAQFLKPGLTAVVFISVYLLLGFLAGVGQFTAFRYLATRTSLRGVRFRMEGSPVRYGLSFLGYGLLSLVTLGWFWPAANRRLAAPLWDGLRYGDRRFRFDLKEARKSKVYGAYALGWIAALIIYVMLLVAMIAVMNPLMQSGVQEPSLEQFAKIYALTLGMMFLLLLAFAPYHAAAIRSVAAGIDFEGVRFRMTLSWLDMGWLWISNLVLLMISLGFLTPFLEARTSRFIISRLKPQGSLDLSATRQVEGDRPKVGEGLADAFGMATL